jgi:uncharacterized cupin superfamily protein
VTPPLPGFIDPREAVLRVVGPKPGATSGEPVESDLELYDDGRTSIGIWECTPGRWPSEKVGLGELMHFVAGSGRIIDDDGTRHEIRPGVVRFFPDGWHGRWEVDETVRKVYVIVRSGG